VGINAFTSLNGVHCYSLLLGQDPIIGGPPPPPVIIHTPEAIGEGEITVTIDSEGSGTFVIDGFSKPQSATVQVITPDNFVTSRGGEYSFTPSLSTL